MNLEIVEGMAVGGTPTTAGVKRRLTYEKDSYVRTKFITTAGIVLLKKGRSYKRPKC